MDSCRKFWMSILISIIFNAYAENASDPLNNHNLSNTETCNCTDKNISLAFANFKLEPYKKNFLTLGRRKNSPDTAPPYSGDNYEAYFQISFKIPFSLDSKWHFAFTQKAWWDVGEDSMPFGEINFNPEFFYKYSFGNKHSVWLSPYEHESNGKDGITSRSWNRAYVRYMYTTSVGSNHYIKLGTKVWGVLNKAAENENIRREFLGSYHLTASYWSNDHSHIELFFRPGKNGRDAVELNLSQPIPYVSNANFNMYFSYFKGFGESLVSYNQETESVHIGAIVNHSIF